MHYNLLLTGIYFASLIAIIVGTVVAAFNARGWLGPVGSLLLGVIATAAIAMFEHPPRPATVAWVSSQALLSILSYHRWRRWSDRRDRRAEDRE